MYFSQSKKLYTSLTVVNVNFAITKHTSTSLLGKCVTSLVSWPG